MRRVRSHREQGDHGTAVRAAPVSPKPSQTHDAHAHEGGAPQDHATYTCKCGFVFEADVSTTVQCPLCASSQAW